MGWLTALCGAYCTPPEVETCAPMSLRESGCALGAGRMRSMTGTAFTFFARAGFFFFAAAASASSPPSPSPSPSLSEMGSFALPAGAAPAALAFFARGVTVLRGERA